MAPSVPPVVRVLLVSHDDGDAASATALLLAFDPPRHRVERVRDAAAAAAAAAERCFDVVLLDGGLGQDHGHALVQRLRRRGFEGAFLALAAVADRGDDIACMRAGVADFLVRESVDADHLERSLRYACEHARIKAELMRSNAELDRFATAVSHDLRQPLHLVSGYAELLGTCCQGQLEPDARHALGQIGFGAQRMNELIEDLLVYARLGRGESALGPVDTSFVLELVERELQDSGAIVDRGMLPTVQGYRPLIEQLLRNLVSNAVKFSGGTRPRVFVGAESRGDDWIFCVRDRGPGIPTAYLDCLFEMFTRGPQRDEVEGTGIGLAICKKAVQDHGGRIWIESEMGKGTTVWFTLPRRNSRG